MKTPFLGISDVICTKFKIKQKNSIKIDTVLHVFSLSPGGWRYVTKKPVKHQGNEMIYRLVSRSLSINRYTKIM